MMKDKILNDESFGHELTHMLGENIGYGWILGLAAFGAIFFFRKRIKRFFE